MTIPTQSTHAVADKRFQDQWRRLMDTLQEAGQIVQEDDLASPSFMQAQSVRYLLRIFRGMEFTALELDDPYFPRLGRMFDTYLPYPNSNPDCVYMFGRVTEGETYRITGNAGTARILEVQIMNGQFPAGPNHKSLGTLTDLKGDADGSIEIVLSAEPHEGNWLPLKPGASWFYLRQYYYDWETELPADLIIERDGAQFPPPIITEDELHARMERIIGWIPTWYDFLRKRVNTYLDAPVNTCQFSPSPSGMDDMQYGKGTFSIAPDEAAIVEFDPPQCPYWSFQVMNDFWETMDFDMRQTSLNGHQAKLDNDGVFRAVISIEDPGVENWLDPVGNSTGLICARVLRPDTQPQVRMRKVKLSDLRNELPSSTKFLTAAQRSDVLRARTRATARRFRE
ncbi:MAG: hypothetical protein CME88_02130 [Hirschia sp.]|nr:hypothetical protein [Hirschia sp.]MBF17161.1 hypothetical protein [Hirschia sp.]